jgi:hypothetical protein
MCSVLSTSSNFLLHALHIPPSIKSCIDSFSLSISDFLKFICESTLLESLVNLWCRSSSNITSPISLILPLKVSMLSFNFLPLFVIVLISSSSFEGLSVLIVTSILILLFNNLSFSVFKSLISSLVL